MGLRPADGADATSMSRFQQRRPAPASATASRQLFDFCIFDDFCFSSSALSPYARHDGRQWRARRRAAPFSFSACAGRLADAQPMWVVLSRAAVRGAGEPDRHFPYRFPHAMLMKSGRDSVALLHFSAFAGMSSDWSIYLLAVDCEKQ